MSKRKLLPPNGRDLISMQGGTYGQLEALAGIEDRRAFWKRYAHLEEEAREALVQLAGARLDACEFCLIGGAR